MNERPNEWMNERTNQRMSEYEWIIERPIKRMKQNEWMNDRTIERNKKTERDGWIGHYRVPKTLTFKMRLGAQPFLWKMSFISTRMKNDFHFKGWAPTLVFKQRPGGTRKWPIDWWTNAEKDEWIKSKESFTHHIFCNRMRRTLLSRCGTRFIFIGLFPSHQFLPVSSWGSYNGPVFRALHHNLFQGPPQRTLSHVSADTAVRALHIYFEFRVVIWW